MSSSMNVPKGNNRAAETQESRDENRAAELDREQSRAPNVARSNSNCRELLFLPISHGSVIPKRVATVDEKYVLHCLELLHNCALRAATSKVHISPGDMANKLAVECPFVSGGQSVINILSSPLRQKFDFDFGRRKLLETVCSDLLKPELEAYESPPRHKRLVSISSTSTACSDKSSLSRPATSFQGLLTCTWKDGLPSHVFTVDDKTEEVYVASVSRDGPFNGDGHDSDYVYTFCSRKKEAESQSVGTMRVSTSITLSSNKSWEVRETRFILSLKDPTDEIQIGNHDRKMSNRLKRKVAKVFRSSHSWKHRPSTGISRSGPIFEDSLWDPSDSEDRARRKSVGNYNHAPNLELGAIIVRDVCKIREEEDPGGWGLKFLKKSGKDASVKTILPSECSTSLDVLIPAGLHGGPIARVGGPSSLVERWVSGGRCDCGGWDIGCPLSVLTVGPSSANSTVVVDKFGECNSVDLFMQDSKQDIPTFKVANIHNGLYYIQFRSSLSTLQSFAIAAAIIHSRSPVLRFNVYRT